MRILKLNHIYVKYENQRYACQFFSLPTYYSILSQQGRDQSKIKRETWNKTRLMYVSDLQNEQFPPHMSYHH